MKDRVDKKSAANAGDGNSSALPGHTQPFDMNQSIKQRRITERKLIDSNALSYLMSPTSEAPKNLDDLNDDNLKLI